MLQQQNACGALKISKAIVLGLVTISLISLSLVGTPSEVSAAAGIIPPIVPPGPVGTPAGAASVIDPCSNAMVCQITKFDVPGATDTYPRGINSQGQVAGSYLDSAGHLHGFVRDADGHYTYPIDYPSMQDTGLQGINDLGQVTGNYYASPFLYGFVMDANGTITTLTNNGTSWPASPNAINNMGQVVGIYAAPDGASRGFMWGGDANGAITTIDVQLGGTSGWTIPTGINNLSQVAGTAFVGGFYGFVGDPNGYYGYSTFRINDAATFVQAINDRGQVAGGYNDPSGISRGFVCDVFDTGECGDISTFDVDAKNTGVVGINVLGEAAGIYGDDITNFARGFVRGADGTIARIDVSGASATYPVGINDLGQVAGHYYTNAGGASDGHSHGFLWRPPLTMAPPLSMAPDATLSAQVAIVPSAGAFDVQGTFTLGTGRTINPLTDPLIVKLYGTGPAPARVSIAIPGGSFHQPSIRKLGINTGTASGSATIH